MRIRTALAAAKTRALAQLRLLSVGREYARYRTELAAGFVEPRLEGLVCQLATAAQIDSAIYRSWSEELRLPAIRHRKYWEYAYIMQALCEHGCLAPGRRGLGFGVGREPLASVMAREGCEVLASDAGMDEAVAKGWAETGQHAGGLAVLNEKGICPAEAFAARVRFRVVDMNDIPDDLRDFDFCWSSCAFEHLGDLERGLAFVRRSLDCVRPGGVVVHTTEFNLSSNDATLDHDDTVLFRRRDIDRLIREVRAAGHRMEVNYHPGGAELDRVVDLPPYRDDPHVKLLYSRYVTTSIGLLIEKAR